MELLFKTLSKYFGIKVIVYVKGAKGDWDFRNSDLVKTPEGTDI